MGGGAAYHKLATAGACKGGHDAAAVVLPGAPGGDPRLLACSSISNRSSSKAAAACACCAVQQQQRAPVAGTQFSRWLEAAVTQPQLQPPFQGPCLALLVACPRLLTVQPQQQQPSQMCHTLAPRWSQIPNPTGWCHTQAAGSTLHLPTPFPITSYEATTSMGSATQRPLDHAAAMCPLLYAASNMRHSPCTPPPSGATWQHS
jgi:hypothetical protein